MAWLDWFDWSKLYFGNNIQDVRYEPTHLNQNIFTGTSRFFWYSFKYPIYVSITPNDSQGIFEKYMVSINSYRSRCIPTMNTIPIIHVDPLDPTSMSETNSISTSIKLGSLFDNTLQFLGWIIHIVLGFFMLNTSSCLPSKPICTDLHSDVSLQP